jgi:hypothetical protein
MESLRTWIEHGLRHLTLSFIFALLGVDAVISAIATWLVHTVTAWLGLATIPIRYYVVLGILVFCAVTLFALLILILHKSVAVAEAPVASQAMPNLDELRGQLFPQKPPDPPKPVDLQGRILELYIETFDALPHVSKTYVAMKVQIKNHGPDEATIVSCGLRVSLGTWEIVGQIMKAVPDDWRIKKRREDNFFVAAFDEVELDPPLRGDAVYKKGHPILGWLAFELYVYGDVEFPNAQFDLSLTDSFDRPHLIVRPPGVYPKTGELIRISRATIPAQPAQS